MNRRSLAVLALFLIAAGNPACWSRALREGAGVVTGASGKVVVLQPPPSLKTYKGLRVEEITVPAGLELWGKVSGLVRDAFIETGAKFGLTAGGTPALVLAGEIIHYESGGVVDQAIGPLQQIIIRTKIRDADSENWFGEANLIGRSKAITSSGRHNLAEGAGKALADWLEEHGLHKLDED